MTTKEITLEPLVQADRCDGCSAAALHRVAFETKGGVGYLDFCGHHYDKAVGGLGRILAHIEK